MKTAINPLIYTTRALPNTASLVHCCRSVRRTPTVAMYPTLKMFSEYKHNPKPKPSCMVAIQPHNMMTIFIIIKDTKGPSHRLAFCGIVMNTVVPHPTVEPIVTEPPYPANTALHGKGEQDQVSWAYVSKGA
jgi:hypothetical protein